MAATVVKSLGNKTLPRNAVPSWGIKILKLGGNNGLGILIEVASFGTNRDENKNYMECGWCFGCFESAFWTSSQFPKEIDPNKGGWYILTMEAIFVLLWAQKKGELSIPLDGVNFCVVHEGIPLTKSLSPFVLFFSLNDSVGLVIWKRR